MTDIFISYSRNDREQVRLIAEALEREGLNVWWDPEIPPGESFSQVIDRQLKEAKCIIAVWSNSSVNSNWVQEEADDGMMRNTLVPVMIDDIELPRGFKRLQTADLRGWRGDIKDPNWQLILTQVRKLVSAHDADEAAERQAATRERRAAASAPSAKAPQPKKGGAPIGLIALGLVMLAGGAAAYYFLMRQGAGSDAPETVVAEEIEEPAVSEPAEENFVAEEEPTETEDKSFAEAAEELPAEIEETPSRAPEPVGTAAMPTIADGAVFRDCDACPQMRAFSAGGSFAMGAPGDEFSRDDAETPQVSVTLARPFAIGVYEVTYDEWNACLADDGCRNYEPPDMGWGQGQRPVVNISYEDAKSFVSWLSRKTGERYRLPSEAEWEYAARAGSAEPFTFGDLITTAQANYNGQYPYKNASQGSFRSKTTAVGAFAPNAFGLYDVHGNVWEWTEDCWRPSHRGAPQDGSPVGGACSSRALKGGAWNAGAWRLRSGHRKAAGDDVRDFDTGFRVARDF